MATLILLFAMMIQDEVTIDQFRSTRVFRCDFVDGVGRAYPEDGSAPASSPSVVEAIKDLVIEAIDFAKNSALMSGGGAPKGVAVRLAVIAGHRGTSFLGTSIDGNPMLMTVFLTPRPNRKAGSDAYFAVMSRHSAYTADAAASQLYGICHAAS